MVPIGQIKQQHLNQSWQKHLSLRDIKPQTTDLSFDMKLEFQPRRQLVQRFFGLAMAISLLLLVFVGFHPTFFLRRWHHPTGLSFPLLVHGWTMTSWFVLVLIQTLLVQQAKIDWHRRLGFLGLATGISVICSGFLIVRSTIVRAKLSGRDIPGNIESFTEVFWSNLSPLLTFAMFFALAIFCIRFPQLHRRSIWFASIALIEPAMSRAWILPDIVVWGEINLNTLVFSWVMMWTLPISIFIYDIATLRRFHGFTAIGVPMVIGLPKLFAWILPETVWGQGIVRWLAT